MLQTVLDWKDPGYEAICTERAERLLALRRMSPQEQAEVHAYYAENPIDWIEDWAHTWDQNRLVNGQIQALRPFMLFPRQRELINFWHGCNRDREDGIVEKTREVGVSWCAVVYGVWMWLYKPGATIGYGSYKEDKVDVLGNSDSLLEKCRIVIRHLPIEMLPAGLDMSKGGHLLKKLLKNPVTGAQIVGEVGSDNIGRGAKASIYFIDEYAFLKAHDAVDASLASCSDCKIFISTAYGTGAFYQKTLSSAFRQFRFEWREDPRKDLPWYEKYKAKWGETITAREVDIDHLASIEDLVCEAKWVEASINLYEVLKDKGIALPSRQDFKIGIGGFDVGAGVAKSVFIARYGPYINAPEAWVDKDKGTGTGQRALMHARRQRTHFLHYDAPGVGIGVHNALKASTPQQRVLDPIAEPAKAAFLETDETPSERAKREVNALFQADVESTVLPGDAIKAAGMEVVRARGVNTGDAPTKWVRQDDGRRSSEVYFNLRAEIWFAIRHRLEKTYEMYLWLTDQGGSKHPLDECIFLPNCEQLKKELAAPTWHMKTNGKIGIERKEDMKARGVPSPDHADALALTFVPVPPGPRIVKDGRYF